MPVSEDYDVREFVGESDEHLPADSHEDAVLIELNRVFKRLGAIWDVVQDIEKKTDELITDSRAARPLLDKYLKLTSVSPPWAKKKVK